MKIIFAQGNPGKQYENTRHNVGFLALEHYAKQHNVEFQSKMKFNADIAELSVGTEKVLFVKPMTFYNETGVSARAIIDFYKVDTSDMLVIHDELALPFGTIRVRHSGRDAGNNGIKSLNAHIGEHFTRIRIGIRNGMADHYQDSDFVLGKFTSEEYSTLHKDAFPLVSSLLDQFFNDNLEDQSMTL